MVYRAPGRKIVLKEYEFKLTRKEAIEAITFWLRDKRGQVDTPADATDSRHTRVVVDKHHVVKDRPLKICWSVLEGEEP